MLKKINKFSILAVLYTILYVMISTWGLYYVDIPMDGMIKFLHRYLTIDHALYIAHITSWMIFDVIYLGPMFLAIILGIKAVKETHKTKKTGEKWFMFFLTIINIFVIVVSLLPFIFPSKFLN